MLQIRTLLQESEDPSMTKPLDGSFVAGEINPHGGSELSPQSRVHIGEAIEKKLEDLYVLPHRWILGQPPLND